MFIQAEDLRKDYHLGQSEVRALDGISLAIPQGDFVAIMGASGSGKSTLLNVIGGLDRPSRGRMVVGGNDLTALNERGLSAFRQKRVGFVFQKFHLLSALTALENVEYPLIFAGRPEAERRPRARAALEAVGLSDRAQHRPAELSGGQQQRVAIARAMVNQPDLLLADEPTGNLDSQTSAEIMALLTTLHQRGHTILIVTHDAAIAAHARRRVWMQDGKIKNDA